MFEELKSILSMVQELPDAVMNVLLGFAVYKIIIFLGTSAGIYGTLRLAINKWHDYVVRKLENENKPKEYSLEGHFIDETVRLELMGLISRMKRSTGSYIHSSDLALIREAVKFAEQKEYEQEHERRRSKAGI